MELTLYDCMHLTFILTVRMEPAWYDCLHLTFILTIQWNRCCMIAPFNIYFDGKGVSAVLCD